VDDDTSLDVSGFNNDTLDKVNQPVNGKTRNKSVKISLKTKQKKQAPIRPVKIVEEKAINLLKIPEKNEKEEKSS